MKVATPVFAGLITIEWIGFALTSSSVPYSWTRSASEPLEIRNGATGAATTTTTTIDSINPISPPPAILLEYVISIPASIITYTTMTYEPITPSDTSETPVTDAQPQDFCGLSPSGSDTRISSSQLFTQQPGTTATPLPNMQSASSSSASLGPPRLTPPYPIPPSLSLGSAVSGSGAKLRINNSLGPSAVGSSLGTQPAPATSTIRSTPPASTLVYPSTADLLITEVVVVDSENNPISTAYIPLY